MQEKKVLEKLLQKEDVLYTMYNIGRGIVSGFVTREEMYLVCLALFGNTVLFSKRSLNVARHFFKKYEFVASEYWDDTGYMVIDQLLKQGLSIKKDIRILTIIRREKLNQRESLYYVRNHQIKKLEEGEDYILQEYRNLWINGK